MCASNIAAFTLTTARLSAPRVPRLPLQPAARAGSARCSRSAGARPRRRGRRPPGTPPTPSKSRRHRAVGRIAGVLLVDDRRHPPQRLQHLLAGADAVPQPVGHVLRGDAQRRAVLHQRHVVDVRHLRAADPLVDPAHDVAEDALGVVVELALHLLGASSSAASPPAGSGCPRAAPAAPADRPRLRLARRRPGGSASRAASPRSATGTQAVFAPGARLRHLLAPASPPSGPAPPTSPCRSARRPAGRRRARRRRSSPRRPGTSAAALHLALAGSPAPASIEVWISSPVRSRKPVLMKTTRLAAAADALLEVHRRAALLVHDPDLQRVAAPGRAPPRRGRRSRRRRRPPRDRASSASPRRPTRRRVRPPSARPRSCSAASAGDQRVHDPLGHLARRRRRGSPGVVMQVADVADQHQRPTAHRTRRSRPARVNSRSGFEPADERAPALRRPPRSRSPFISPSQLR